MDTTTCTLRPTPHLPTSPHQPYTTHPPHTPHTPWRPATLTTINANDVDSILYTPPPPPPQYTPTGVGGFTPPGVLQATIAAANPDTQGVVARAGALLRTQGGGGWGVGMSAMGGGMSVLGMEMQGEAGVGGGRRGGVGSGGGDVEGPVLVVQRVMMSWQCAAWIHNDGGGYGTGNATGGGGGNAAAAGYDDDILNHGSHSSQCRLLAAGQHYVLIEHHHHDYQHITNSNDNHHITTSCGSSSSDCQQQQQQQSDGYAGKVLHMAWLDALHTSVDDGVCGVHGRDRGARMGCASRQLGQSDVVFQWQGVFCVCFVCVVCGVCVRMRWDVCSSFVYVLSSSSPVPPPPPPPSLYHH